MYILTQESNLGILITSYTGLKLRQLNYNAKQVTYCIVYASILAPWSSG